MANRETYPASLSPFNGDATAAAGARQLKVVALQGVPISSTAPTDQQTLRYNATANQWQPSNGGVTAVSVDGVPVSDDYIVTVNVTSPITVDGV